MKTKILLNNFSKVKQFSNIISHVEEDIDLASGKYVIDAKSIMGIFSLDLSKPLDIDIHADKERTEEIMEKLNQFVVVR